MENRSYSEKLKDPRWQKKRLQILERDKWTCQFCLDKESTLHVHHLWYTSGEPWDTPDEALIALCSSCHEEESNNRKHEEENLLQVLRETRLSHAEISSLLIAIHESGIKDEPSWSIMTWAIGTERIRKLLHDEYTKLISDVLRNLHG